MANARVIAAVEIGTTKVLSIVAEVVPGESISLLSRAEASSRGVRRGEITDFRAACEAVHAALNISEKNAGVSIESVYLALSGKHLEGFHHVGSSAINTPNGLVCEADLARVIENAKSKALPPGRIYLHHIKNGFFLDGKPLETPLHHKGQRLEVGYWHLHADNRRLSDSISVINRYGLQVEEIIAGGIASANVVCTDEDKRDGCIVLDIGGGTTDYVVFRKGVMARAGVIAIGGDHLTNDLASGLRINFSQAETLKKAHGKVVLEEGDKLQQRWLYGDLLSGNSAIGNRPIKLSAFPQILQPRLEELYDILREELDELFDANFLKAGVILTGGTAHLGGIVELTRRRLSLECRLASGVPWVSDISLKSPECTAALGLLHHALSAPSRAQQNPRTGLLEKFSKLFSAQ